MTQDEEADLMKTLVEVVVPLEVIYGMETIHPDPYLSPDLKKNIEYAVFKVRKTVKDYLERKRKREAAKSGNEGGNNQGSHLN